MKRKRPLISSKQPTTCPSPQPDESSRHLSIIFIKIFFNVTLSCVNASIFQMISSLQVAKQIFVLFSCISHTVYMPSLYVSPIQSVCPPSMYLPYSLYALPLCPSMYLPYSLYAIPLCISHTVYMPSLYVSPIVYMPSL
jgi:hypothetical protein